MHARCQASSKKSLEAVNGSNCIDPGYSSHSHIDKKTALGSGNIISKMMIRIKGKLTPMGYVREQYISPRKKSLNSTGYRPASSNRNFGLLATLVEYGLELLTFEYAHHSRLLW